MSGFGPLDDGRGARPGQLSSAALCYVGRMLLASFQEMDGTRDQVQPELQGCVQAFVGNDSRRFNRPHVGTVGLEGWVLERWITQQSLPACQEVQPKRFVDMILRTHARSFHVSPQGFLSSSF